MVLIPRWIPPSRIPARRPFSPSTTPCTAASSASMVTTMRAPVAASRGVSHSVAPWGTFPLLRFQARTVNPAATRFAAMGRPISPRPQNPTVSISVLPEEGLQPPPDSFSEQRPVHAQPGGPGLARVGVVPEGGEVQPLQIHVPHFAQVLDAVLAVHPAQARR